MRRIRWAFFFIVLGGGMLFLFAIFTMQVTSSPKFCGTCHVMKPYYKSWQTSKHNRIACVECHIPPGIGSEFRKKYEALSMAVRYITGTYGTNPWAEVEDASCLRCHEKRIIQGRELFKGVLFDHTPHLLELRRGKKLRCTSCHSQIVQGKHISATESTCFLCHFKDQEPGKGTAQCQICHITPDKIVESQGVKFNHGDVKRFGMDCNWCHRRSVKGDGSVPKERCLVCHNEPKRLEMYANSDFLHEVHVTDHKVECLNCHLEIQHGAFSLEAASTSCSQCHESGHNPVRDLYAGLGGKGVAPKPSIMFLTGISCDGCHFLRDTAKGGLKRASDVSCMACHGPRYRKVYKEWKGSLDRAEKKVIEAMARAPERLKGSPQWSDIRANVRFIREARGIHNPPYALALLEWSWNRMKAAMGDRLPDWVKVPYETRCTSCHLGIADQEGSFGNYSFSHTLHVYREEVECGVCHRTHEEKVKGEILRPGADCVTCHHSEKIKRGCSSCHRRVPEEITLKGRGTFPHAFHFSEDVGLECKSCHVNGAKVSFSICSDCHE
jgi:nitrate/TMAO reductase-like tetraheme cytochrome c subunit